MSKLSIATENVIVLHQGRGADGKVLISSAPQSGAGDDQNGRDTLRQLREDILTGVFAPEQKLKFEDLRTRYAVSVSTLREALLQLGTEGLVRTELNRGFAVAPVSVADLMDITTLRVQFEAQALTDSIEHGDDAWEAEIVTSLHLLIKLTTREAKPTRSSEWPMRHRRFHQALVAGCRSPWTLHFRSVLFDQAERYRSLGRIHRRVPRDVAEDHRILANAVIARNVAKATKLAEQHIRSTVENALATVPDLNTRKPR